MNMHIVINGYKGRMGRALIDCALRSHDIVVVGTIDIDNKIGYVIRNADVVIDFSNRIAILELVDKCVLHRKPLVIGTTGHSISEMNYIEHHSANIPIVLASNFSTGVNTLFWLTRKAAEILGPDFDLEIVEMHHRMKMDAPSGTAKTLANVLAEVRKQSTAAHPATVFQYGRVGDCEKRNSEVIGIHCVRGGDIVGEHTVIFAGDGERIELTHKASSRKTFARGALLAARWVLTQKPGLYSMEHVLGLTQPPI